MAFWALISATGNCIMANVSLLPGFSRPRLCWQRYAWCDREAIIRTIRQFGIGVFIARSAENGTCNQTTSFPGFSSLSPSTASRCSKTPVCPLCSDCGVGHHRRVVPLIMRHGMGQSYAASWWLIAPSQPQPGLQPLNPLFRRRWYRTVWRSSDLSLCDVGDFVLVGGFLIDQVTRAAPLTNTPSR